MVQPLPCGQKKKSKTAKRHCRHVPQVQQKVFNQLGVSFDIYDRTSADHHHQTAKELFSVLEKKGSFIKEESEQYYDKEFNQFLADRYITGDAQSAITTMPMEISVKNVALYLALQS